VSRRCRNKSGRERRLFGFLSGRCRSRNADGADDEGRHKMAVLHVIALRPIVSSKKHHGPRVPGLDSALAMMLLLPSPAERGMRIKCTSSDPHAH
jgi:hypothetical protein